jgi:DNA-binding GntR family transcriptional regulator
VDIVGALGVDLGLHYHAQLLDAVTARDKARAQKLMAEHIESTIRGMQEKRP